MFFANHIESNIIAILNFLHRLQSGLYVNHPSRLQLTRLQDQNFDGTLPQTSGESSNRTKTSHFVIRPKESFSHFLGKNENLHTISKASEVNALIRFSSTKGYYLWKEDNHDQPTRFYFTKW